MTGFFNSPVENDAPALYRLSKAGKSAGEAPATPDDRECRSLGADRALSDMPDYLLADIGVRAERSGGRRFA
ncbi:MAG: hypothetical protein AAFR16_04630 [Pseudomonadota bacterium]